MFKNVSLYMALATFATVGSSLAQTIENPNGIRLPPVIESPKQTDAMSGTKYKAFNAAEFESSATGHMQALLADIVTWLSINFGLPAIYDHPRVELVPQMKMAALRYRGLVSERQPYVEATGKPEMPLDQGRNVLAIYDEPRKTIYLPDGWTGATPAELSVLVHEMVHHLQNLAGLKFECPQAREKPAYAAQEKWLEQSGGNLMDDFEIDPFEVLVRTICFY